MISADDHEPVTAEWAESIALWSNTHGQRGVWCLRETEHPLAAIYLANYLSAWNICVSDSILATISTRGDVRRICHALRIHFNNSVE